MLYKKNAVTLYNIRLSSEIKEKLLLRKTLQSKINTKLKLGHTDSNSIPNCIK